MVSDAPSLLVIITILIMANIIIESRLKILHADLTKPYHSSVTILEKFSESENPKIEDILYTLLYCIVIM